MKKEILFGISILVAVGLIVMGLNNNGFYSTQGKGSGICMECVGFGQD